MTSLIGTLLRASLAFMVAIYVLYPREIDQWLRSTLQGRAAAFCSRAAYPASGVRFLMNRGQCAAAGKDDAGEKPGMVFQSLLRPGATLLDSDR